ncbi:hypothetical protein FQN54_009268 [Arachnomyces sp. PD_36]|nr:hypothetical protein FQN54_009268 [Arachnomyces sp. PD_36]
MDGGECDQELEDKRCHQRRAKMMLQIVELETWPVETEDMKRPMLSIAVLTFFMEAGNGYPGETSQVTEHNSRNHGCAP